MHQQQWLLDLVGLRQPTHTLSPHALQASATRIKRPCSAFLRSKPPPEQSTVETQTHCPAWARQARRMQRSQRSHAQRLRACMKGDMVMYVCGACHSVRSSAWNPNGVSVRLYAPLRMYTHGQRACDLHALVQRSWHTDALAAGAMDSRWGCIHVSLLCIAVLY